jgi:hypothetical protein
MLFFISCVVMVGLSIPGLIWFFFFEYSYCQNSIFPNAERLTGVKNILLIRANGSEELGNGSINKGFRIFENGNLVAEFKEFCNEQIVIGMKRNFHYRNVQFGFKIEPAIRKVEFYEGDTKIGIFKRAGFGYKKKTLELLGSNLAFLDIEKWNPDFDIYDANAKIATKTFDHGINILRQRKLCFIENVDIRMEALQCMIAAFTIPKCGRMGRQ